MIFTTFGYMYLNEWLLLKYWLTEKKRTNDVVTTNNRRQKKITLYLYFKMSFLNAILCNEIRKRCKITSKIFHNSLKTQLVA